MPLTNCIHQPLSPSSMTPNVVSIIKEPYISSNSSNLKSKPAKSHKVMAKKVNHDCASQRLRELEIRNWKALREITNVAILPFPNLTLTQFYGIKPDE